MAFPQVLATISLTPTFKNQAVWTPKNKKLATDLLNFAKWFSDAHFVPFLFY